MAIARMQRALLDREIDRRLEAGEDCAAISTVLWCRFSDVQAGQQRLAVRRAEAERAARAADEGTTPPSEVDAIAAAIRYANKDRMAKYGHLLRNPHRIRMLPADDYDRTVPDVWVPEPRHHGYRAYCTDLDGTDDWQGG